MSFEEPKECNTEGIKESMGKGMCSDGAMVNRSVYNLLHNEFGEQYLCILCMSHKFELSINLTTVTREMNYTDHKVFL